MRIFNGLKKLYFLIVLLVVNMLLSFLIEPADGASARMWSGYYAQEELDTIFVGSSVCQMTFIPSVFDESLGVKSYNMGTPSQAMPQTMQAVKTAVEEHEIKTVVYAMSYSSLMYEPIPEAEITFESARIKRKSSIAGLLETVEYILSADIIASEKSINFLFPWLYNYEELTIEAMAENVKEKWGTLKKYIQTGEYDPTSGLNKGFRNDENRVVSYENRWKYNSAYFYGEEFSEEMLVEFEEMLVFCQDQGVELIVINAPHPVFDVISSYRSYEKNGSIVKAYCEKYGVEYYDFSLVKADVFETRQEYFGDFEHLNRVGAEKFCIELCEFLKQRADGVNVESYFYTVEEFGKMYEEEFEEWEMIGRSSDL